MGKVKVQLLNSGGFEGFSGVKFPVETFGYKSSSDSVLVDFYDAINAGYIHAEDDCEIGQSLCFYIDKECKIIEDENQALIAKQAEQIKVLREALECISSAIAKYSYTNDAGFNVVEILDIEPQCQLVDSTLESTKD